MNDVLLPTRMDLLVAGAFLARAFRDPTLWARVLRARRYAVLCATALVTVIKRPVVAFLEPF